MERQGGDLLYTPILSEIGQRNPVVRKRVVPQQQLCSILIILLYTHYTKFPGCVDRIDYVGSERWFSSLRSHHAEVP
jgi:hypothetical protein